jgi:hypothetical protein
LEIFNYLLVEDILRVQAVHAEASGWMVRVEDDDDQNRRTNLKKLTKNHIVRLKDRSLRNLEELKVHLVGNSSQLESSCGEFPTQTFRNLKVLEIQKCDSVRYFWLILKKCGHLEFRATVHSCIPMPRSTFEQIP